MTDQNSLKQRAAIAAIDHLPGDGTIGIGTGSTVDFFIDALVTIENRINSVVASSERTTRRLADIGIEVQDLNHSNELAVYIDGADEIDPHGRLIKGGGGAHAREKVLAAAARKFVCIVD
ncbi:MAG: ribose 5-phosphate isomerase A, partial [Gammaproteobacteria bacterium]|nr:ribose 5-phosphate isomerase A [Gammaproteobacteria bacterium]